MTTQPLPTPKRAGFTLVELLIVISIISIMASIVISAFSNAAADTRLVLARQQQAVVQEAVNSWLSHDSAAPNSIHKARADYSAATTSKARLDLVQGYLNDSTYNDLAGAHTTDDRIYSEAMYQIGCYLQISAWPTASGDYPKVNLVIP